MWQLKSEFLDALQNCSHFFFLVRSSAISHSIKQKFKNENIWVSGVTLDAKKEDEENKKPSNSINDVETNEPTDELNVYKHFAIERLSTAVVY